MAVTARADTCTSGVKMRVKGAANSCPTCLQAQHPGVRHRDDHDVLLGLQDTLGLSRSQVVAQNGGSPSCHAAQRHGDHQHEALGNGGRRHQQIALALSAVALEQGIEDDDHQVIHRNDQEGRQTGKQNAAHQPWTVTAK